MMSEKFLCCCSGKKRNIAGEDDDFAVILFERIACLFNGMACTELFFLNCRYNLFTESFNKMCNQSFAGMANNNNDGACIERDGKRNNVFNHWFAANGVHDFSKRRVIHPLTLSGGKNYCGKIGRHSYE